MIISMYSGNESNKSLYQDVIAITNRKLVKGDYLAQLTKVAALSPYGMILREKDLSDQEYEKLTKEVIRICEAHQTTLFLHSRYQIAKKLNCSNIHLSVAGLKECYQQLEGFKRISVSCHSVKDVEEAIDLGATQIVLGTIFETDCKKGLKGRGTGFVEEVVNYCKERMDREGKEIPVFAIGGISPQNLDLVKKAGARGGCMMSYMMTI